MTYHSPSMSSFSGAAAPSGTKKHHHCHHHGADTAAAGGQAFRATKNELTNSLHEQSNKDELKTMKDVNSAMRQSGIEAATLLVFIDFTGSNRYSGEKTFDGKPLHTIETGVLNPYQEAIQVAEAVAELDSDGLIPAYGFGDSHTTDKKVFSFEPTGQPCAGMAEVLRRYADVARSVKLSGPTSFVPILDKAIETVKQSAAANEEGKMDYHIVLILCDGQVDNPKTTRAKIVEASQYPISIVCIGVGDGPWDEMHKLDDNLPGRAIDNFQFVPFYDTYHGTPDPESPFAKIENPTVRFAVTALQELPTQYTQMKQKGYFEAR